MNRASRWICGSVALLFVLLAFVPVASANDPYYTWPDSNETGRRLGRAATEVFLANFVVWTFDRYIRPAPEGGEKGDGFRVGTNSWWNNIKNGYEWDDNNFGTNQWGHPYHGALFFTAGRANGFSFWDSAPFAFAGSFGWEYFGETHNAAFNDWVNTSVGGIALGEVLHRSSSMVLDNQARGSERVWREVGGFVIDPVRGFNRLMTGQATKRYPNSANRFPDVLGLEVAYGLRTEGDQRLWDDHVTRGYVRAELTYGDPFQSSERAPFSDFNFIAQINFADATPIGEFNARGTLGAKDLHKTSTSHHMLAAYHHFDYVDNAAIVFGAQSIGASLQSRLTSDGGGSPLELRTHLDGNVILLGAVESDYADFAGRDYDYGPGASIRVGAEFRYEGVPILNLQIDEHFIHSINGTQSDHLLSVNRLRFQAPIYQNYGLALDYVLYLRESSYENFDDVSARSPEIRLSVFSGFYR